MGLGPSDFRVWVWGLRFWVWTFRIFRVWGLGFKVLGLEFRVWDLGLGQGSGKGSLEGIRGFRLLGSASYSVSMRFRGTTRVCEGLKV